MSTINGGHGYNNGLQANQNGHNETEITISAGIAMYNNNPTSETFVLTPSIRKFGGV